MKNIISYLLFILAIVALYGFAFIIGQDNEPVGQNIFENNQCNVCHSVKSYDIMSRKAKGIDLSNIGNKYNSQFLIDYLNKKEKIEGKPHILSFKGNEKDLQTLTDWLGTLQSQK